MEATAPTTVELLAQAEQAWAHIDVVKYTFDRVIYEDGKRGFKVESETTEAKVYFDMPDSASELKMLIETGGVFDSRYVYHDRVVEVEDDPGVLFSFSSNDGKVAYYVDDYGPNDDFPTPDLRKVFKEDEVRPVDKRLSTTQVYWMGNTLRMIDFGVQQADGTETTLDVIAERARISEQEALQMMVGSNRHGRLIATEEVSAAAMWLVGPGSDSVNGQAIQIAGGQT